MELERMEKLAALEHRIDIARERLRVDIGIRLMDISQAIEEIKLQLQEAQEAQGRQRGSQPSATVLRKIWQ